MDIKSLSYPAHTRPTTLVKRSKALISEVIMTSDSHSSHGYPRRRCLQVTSISDPEGSGSETQLKQV